MEKQKMKNYTYINKVKLFAIIIIIINHSMQYPGCYNVFKIISNDFQNPILFFSSGVIFSYCIHDCNKYKTYKELLYKKVKRIAIPYFLTAFLFFIPFMRFFKLSDYSAYSIREIMINVILGRNMNYLWFIYALFVMYVITYPIIRRKLPQWIKIIILFGMYVCNLMYTYATNLFCTNMIMRYILFFVVGCWYNENFEKISEILEKYKKKLCISSVVMVIIIYIIDIKTGYIAGSQFGGGGYQRILLASLEIVKQFEMIGIILGCFHLLERNCNYRKSMHFLERNSFKLYLLHEPFVALFIASFPMIITNGIRSIICAICAIGCTLLVIMIMDLTHRLFVGKLK